LQDVVFAVDPRAVIQDAVNDRVTTADRTEALAFVEQARAFYKAAGAAPRRRRCRAVGGRRPVLRSLGAPAPLLPAHLT